MPAIENYLGYICTILVRHLDKQRRRNYNSDNGYTLHQANHIIDVEVGRVPDTHTGL